jgi:hypothetical protein
MLRRLAEAQRYGEKRCGLGRLNEVCLTNVRRDLQGLPLQSGDVLNQYKYANSYPGRPLLSFGNQALTGTKN